MSFQTEKMRATWNKSGWGEPNISLSRKLENSTTLGMFQEQLIEKLLKGKPSECSWKSLTWLTCRQKNFRKLLWNLNWTQSRRNTGDFDSLPKKIWKILLFHTNPGGVQELLSDGTKRDISCEVQVVETVHCSVVHEDKQREGVSTSAPAVTSFRRHSIDRLIKNLWGGCPVNRAATNWWSCFVESIKDDSLHNYTPMDN